jgi:hypothetical protein
MIHFTGKHLMLHHARLPKLISSTHEKLTLRNKQRTDKGNRLYLRIRGQRRRERPNQRQQKQERAAYSFLVSHNYRKYPVLPGRERSRIAVCVQPVEYPFVRFRPFTISPCSREECKSLLAVTRVQLTASVVEYLSCCLKVHLGTPVPSHETSLTGTPTTTDSSHTLCYSPRRSLPRWWRLALVPPLTSAQVFRISQ